MKKSAIPTLAYRVLGTLVAGALFGGLMAPQSAVAAPEDAWESIAITLGDLDLGKEPTLVISAGLREGASLPAEVAIAIPKDATIVWAGELTGDPSNDPIVEISAVERLDDYDLVRFTMTTSPYAQLELGVPEGVITRSAEGRLIELNWISAGQAERARLAIASPLDMHLQSIEPSATGDVREAIVLYSVEAIPVEAGTRLDLSGVMVVGEGPEVVEARRADAPTSSADATGAPDAVIAPGTAPTDTGSSGPDMVTVLLFVLVGALLVVGFLLVRSLRAEKATPGE